MTGWWITAATAVELSAAWQALIGKGELPAAAQGHSSVECGIAEVAPQGPWFSVTGPGSPWTQLRISQGLALLQPQRVMQVGLAGAFADRGLGIGDLVVADEETFGDIGCEWPTPAGEMGQGTPGFKPLASLPWAEPGQGMSLPCSPWPAQVFRHLPALKSGRGLTVNSVTGTQSTAELRQKLFAPDFETMEGAAAALVCHSQSKPFYQLRAISNFVGPRDMRPENFRMALQKLAEGLNAMRGVWPWLV